MLKTHCLSKPINLSRGLATQVSNATFTKHTKLNNGISVYTNSQPTENNHYSNNNTVTLLVRNSGVTSENPYNNGVSHVWSHYYQNDPTLNKWANSNGAILSSDVRRDYQTFSLNGQIPLKESLQFLNSNLLNLQTNKLESHNLSKVKQQVMDKISYQENKQQDKAVIEHLYSTAFQNTPLSLPLLGTLDTVSDLTKDDLVKFAKERYDSTDNLAILVSGSQVANQSHEAIVEAVDQVLSSVSTKGKATDGSSLAKSSFIGSEVRLRDDTLPHAWISIAVESEAVGSPDQLTSEVAAAIFGQYNAFEPRSRLQGIKVLDTLQEYGLCDSFKHFQLSHRDSGLWGMVTRTSNVSGIDDLIHFILKQWNRLSISITETELERGKAMLKLSLAEKYGGTANWADFLVNYPQYKSLDEIFAEIDKVTVKDLKHWANKRLWDQDIAIAGMGQIEDLLDYMRMRNDMSMMRW